MSSKYIGSEELRRIQDRSIDVRLRREVDDRVDTRNRYRVLYCASVADIAANENVARVFAEIRHVRRIAGVGHRVEVDNRNIGTLAQYNPDEMGADES